MADGCYDMDGKCVNCGEYHPCNCEINNGNTDPATEWVFVFATDKNTNERVKSDLIPSAMAKFFTLTHPELKDFESISVNTAHNQSPMYDPSDRQAFPVKESKSKECRCSNCGLEYTGVEAMQMKYVCCVYNEDEDVPTIELIKGD